MAPHRAVGRMVLVKVRGKLLRIFLDEELLAVYQIPDGRGHILCQESFRQALRLDPEQFRRKFQGRRGKGRATIGLESEPPAPAALRRDLQEYDRLLGVAL